MWQTLYVQRLKTDIDLWIERGWVTPANAEAILRQASTGVRSRSMASILAILGVVLIGFAAMSFVAANWDEISKLTKLVMIFAAMWVGYGVAIYANRRNQPNFAQAALLLGLLFFGAAIMLIAQIYHIQTDDPGGILAWCLAALFAAAILPSRPALALGFLLAGIWTAFTHNLDPNAIHWSFLIVWIPAMWLTLALSWTPAIHLGLLALVFWLGINATAFTQVFDLNNASLLGAFGLMALALWLKGVALTKNMARLGTIMEHYGIVLAFALLWVMQYAGTFHDSGRPDFWLLSVLLLSLAGLTMWARRSAHLQPRDLAAMGLIALVFICRPLFAGDGGLWPWINVGLILGLSAWLISYGSHRESRMTVNLGFIAFGGETLYVYFEALGSLLGTAAFFLLGGVLLIAGSLLMERMRRRIVGSVGQDASGEAK